MTKIRILGLGGTMREPSYSKLGLEIALKVAEELGAETHLLDLRTLNLPMFIPDCDADSYAQAETIHHFLDLHRRADAFIWSSPSYHGTVTGIFKNAIDFLELIEKDERPYLTGCPVGVIAVNDSPPIETMRTITRELRAWSSPSTVVLYKRDFNENGTLHNETAIRRIRRIVGEVMDFAKMKKHQ